MNGALEVEEGLIRLLQEAVEVSEVVVGRGMVRTRRKQRLKQMNRSVRPAPPCQTTGFAHQGFGVALSGSFRLGLQGIEHFSCQIVRRVDLQGPQVTLPSLTEVPDSARMFPRIRRVSVSRGLRDRAFS